MNLHVPQSVGATVEAMFLMKSANHIITGQRNGPVNGIVQDGLIGCYLLTEKFCEDDGSETINTLTKETFWRCCNESDIDFDRVQNLFRRAYPLYKEYLRYDKNKKIFSIVDDVPGSLYISIVFPEDFNYTKNTDVNEKYPTVKIIRGVLHPDSGPLCKKSMGSKNLSIVHLIAKEYSPERCLRFLSETQTLTDYWLPNYGFSMGISDCLCTDDSEARYKVYQAETKVQEILDNFEDGVPDAEAENEINDILNSVLNVGLKLSKTSMNKGQRNALNIMRNSGAKGSPVNLVSIAFFVGQQNINGQRIPSRLSLGTRTLCYFKNNDFSAKAKGFIRNGYIKGLDPHEVFFHACSGRLGIVSTAVKTATTGYIQKRFARKCENNRVCIDGTIRDADDKIIQFLYGDDGFDPKKLYNVKGCKYPFFVNPHNLALRLDSKLLNQKKINKKQKKTKLKDNEIDLLLSFVNAGPKHIDNPIIENLNECIHSDLRNMLKKVKIYQQNIPKFCSELRNVCESSKSQYGDMVGKITSHSLGEPTTQLTLNFFHTAGFKGKDVSLGVPRIEELLGVSQSDKQKKPSGIMYFPEEKFKGDKKECLDKLYTFGKNLENSKVNNFFEKAVVMYIPGDLDPEKDASPINLLPSEIYKERWWVKLYKKLYGEHKIEPNYWVVTLHLSVEEMFNRGIDIDELAYKIQTSSDDKYYCVPSPTSLGMIEVYIDFETVCSDITDKQLLEFDLDEELITHRNINYFLSRDVLIPHIKNIDVTGIRGISKTYPRLEDGEWVLDIKFDPLSNVLSKERFIEILTHSCVDFTRTMCDDIHSIVSVLGIEAGRRFLIEEITRVISFDGTYVNPRFFQLLADSMTNTGALTRVTRYGISRDEGPITKILFEEPITNAIDASFNTETDHIQSVSSAVMFGKVSKAGTGSISIRSKDKIPKRPIQIN